MTHIDRGMVGKTFVATHWPITDPEVVKTLMELPENPPDGNGRSEWHWIHLADGDLIVGFFPQADDYEAAQVFAEADFFLAEADSEVCGHVIDND